MFGSSVRYRMVLVVALALLSGLLMIFVLSETASGASDVPAGFEQERVATGLQSPTAMEFAPDGRLFVAEKSGELRVIDFANGGLQQRPFVDISQKVDARGERGLLGVTFHPDFDNNGFVYVYYTQEASGGIPAHNRIVRFEADGNTAVADSEELVFKLNNLSESHNHNGGAIHFGKDNMLYVAVGENRQEAKAQTLENLFGKMLRIEPEPRQAPNTNIPADNPFFDRAKGENRAIWARGLRNPFSFAVQPGTGSIYINDVGAQRFEEINRGRAGANYGWPRYEGRDGNRRYQDPIFTYKHDDLPNSPPGTSGCAITGGTFYNPQAGAGAPFPPEYEGDYFFADFCNSWIRRLDADGKGVKGFATGANRPVDLKVGEDGNLYYLSLGSGSVYEVRYNG
jgi:glucose/arabinose dehydrogenase